MSLRDGAPEDQMIFSAQSGDEQVEMRCKGAEITQVVAVFNRFLAAAGFVMEGVEVALVPKRQ